MAMKMQQIDRSPMKDFWKVYDSQRDRITTQIMELTANHPEFSVIMRSMTPEQIAENDRHTRELQQRAIFNGEWTPYVADLEMQGAHYAQMGISFSAWFEIVSAFRKVLVPYLHQAYGKNADQFIAATNSMDEFINRAMAAIGQAYLSTKEKLIGQQQEALRELSTPVLQLEEGLLILPIIGVIDTQRARQITEGLLRAIRAARAKVVVLDITGVAAVDTKVANHLAQTVEAARLMGAKAIVTGLSAEVAQTLVMLGIDLTKLSTVGDLQGGIQEAHRLLGLRTVKLDGHLAGASPH